MSAMSMSMNSSGGLQKIVHVCKLKIGLERYVMSQNFPNNPHNVKYVVLLVKKSSGVVSFDKK